MKRLALILMGLVMWADPTSEALDVVARMAAALSEGNGPAFMQAVDPKMNGFDQLDSSIQSILQQAEVQSSVSQISNDGETLELDWTLRLKNQTNPLQVESRREAVRCKVVRDEKKRLRVVRLEPLSFFAPPAFR